jgi:DNA helicase-2/ATP-dependent DNA helicase PcrA
MCWPEYQKKFRFILVDEYQDTNTAQYCGCGCWPSGPPANGPQHLLRRRRRPVDLWLARRRGRQHPALREGLSPAPVIRLERNYRSTEHILGAAST